MSRFIPRSYDDWKCTDPADFNEPAPERDPDAEYDAWRDEQMAKDERKIITSHVLPPIPIRSFDWSACYDGQEEKGPYGHGRTEAEAITDLIANTEYDDE